MFQVDTIYYNPFGLPWETPATGARKLRNEQGQPLTEAGGTVRALIIGIRVYGSSSVKPVLEDD